MKGILARKVGMTRMIAEDGAVVPVTVLEAPSAKVLQIKTVDKDGYSAAVLGAFERKNPGKNIDSKYKFIRELELEEGSELKKDDEVTLSSFEGIEAVSVCGTSKGRGFAGVIKRHNFGRGRETHGSHHHREPGSVGTCAKPGRIAKGKKMPGHYGVDRVTIRRTPVVDIDLTKNLIAVKGAVPGAKNSMVFLSA